MRLYSALTEVVSSGDTDKKEEYIGLLLDVPSLAFAGVCSQELVYSANFLFEVINQESDVNLVRYYLQLIQAMIFYDKKIVSGLNFDDLKKYVNQNQNPNQIAIRMMDKYCTNHKSSSGRFLKHP